MSVETVSIERLVQEYIRKNPPASYEEYVGYEILISDGYVPAVEIRYKVKQK